MPSVKPSLWNRDFILWWLGSAQSAFGTALSSIASSFLVLHQTGSAGAMGVNLALGLLPGLLSPFLGALVDRIPLRVPVCLGNALRAAVDISIGVLAWQGEVSLAWIYSGSLVVGLVNAFYQSAIIGMTARLVPAAEIPRATALVQGTNQSMQMAGFFGGGLLVAALGRGSSLVLAGGLFAAFAGLTLLMRLPGARAGTVGETFWTSFTAGLHYVRTRTVLIALPLLILVMNASLAPVELLIPRQMLLLGAGERGFGLYSGLLLGGMTVGSLLLASLGGRVHAARSSVWGLAGTAALLLALAFTHTPLQMYLLAVPAGVMSALLNVGLSVLFQQQVRPEYYERVGSLLTLVGTAGMPLTLLALASIVDQVSLAQVLTVAAMLGLVGTVVWAGILQRAQLLRTLVGVPEA